MGIHTDTLDQLLGISLPPGTILGYRADGRPIHVIAGGAEDDEPDIEVEVDDEPEPEPEVDDEPEPGETPKPKRPTTKAAREKGESRLARRLKLVDTEALDIDEDGSVAGLESAVDDLRRDYPELFAAPPRKPKVRPTGAPRQPAAEKPKSTAEQHAAR